jgi:hypothetical protein
MFLPLALNCRRRTGDAVWHHVDAIGRLVPRSGPHLPRLDPFGLWVDCQFHKNINLLSNLRKSEEVMCVFTNGGSQDYSDIGTLTLFPFNVYYNPRSLANILSLAEVSEMFRVTMDTD